MSFNSRKQFEQRIASLGDHTKDLNADVESLTKALELHEELLKKEKSTTRGILKREIRGSIWENGAEGKLRDYRSSNYTENAAKPPPKPQKTSSKSAQICSKTKKTTVGALKDKTAKDKTYKVERSGPVIEPSVKKVTNIRQRSDTKQLQAKKELSNKKYHMQSSDSDDDVERVASRYSNLNVNLNETYTKDACGHSPYNLPVVPEKDNVERDSSVNSAEKRSRVLKKMIRKLDVDLKLGEYKTSETDSDSLSTPQQAISECTTKPAHYCDPDVLAWLMNQGLKNTEKYARIFSEHKINMSSLVVLDESQLRQMGITASGTLIKLTRAIQDMRKSSSARSPQHALSLDNVREKKSGNHGQQQCHKPKHSGVTRRSVSSDREKPSVRVKELECHPTSGVKQNPVSHSSCIKNSVKPSQVSKKSTSQRRPQSAALSTNKLPHKHRAKMRPTSACLPKAERDGDMKLSFGEGGQSLEQNRESIFSHDATLSGLIAIRPLAAQSTYVLEAKEVVEKSDAANGDAFSTEAESRLQLIEQQIHELHKELKSPAALDIINSLQIELQQIQNEVLSKNRNSTKLTNKDGQLEQMCKQPTSGKDSKPNPKSSQEIRLTSDEVDTDLSGVKDRGSEVATDLSKSRVINPKGLSISLSKTELLREVRKQNDAHRKHIRHLESELSRLKYKDPIRNCEIPEKDIHFNQQDLLGEGAFSQVFRGSYQGSEVAVKRLKVPLSSQDKNYFTAEVSLLRELRHPRVVLLLGVCTTSQNPLMILEYMAQGSLYSYIHNPDNSQLDHAGYYQIAKDMALGMNYLHRHTPVVLHLDLKSMNVLLSTHLRAKIADFGFSKLRHDANQSMAKTSKVHTAGTPAWMAPELLNTGDISTKSDVYSYGIILWEMLTRKHPYEGCSMFQVIERTRTNKRLDIPSYCPSGLRNLITSCWSQNPAKRPSFKDILSTLEKLQFPGEWRTLFAEAGIPEAVLNNVESSRTLIDIVTLTLEDVPKHPDDIPILNLEDSDDGHDAHPTVQFDSEDDWEDVTGDDEDSELDTNHRSAYRPHDVPSLNLNFSGDLSESKKATVTRTPLDTNKQQNTATDYEIKSAKCKMTALHNAAFTTQGVNPLHVQADIPPPPSIDQAPCMKVNAPDLLKHTAAKQMSKVHDSFMEQLELALKDPQPLSKLHSAATDRQRAPMPQKPSRFNLRASQLLSQKNRLRSTDKPHPCQLRDLSLVSEEKRKDLFDVLRKAVESRRLRMCDGKSLEQSLSADWSLDD